MDLDGRMCAAGWGVPRLPWGKILSKTAFKLSRCLKYFTPRTAGRHAPESFACGLACHLVRGIGSQRFGSARAAEIPDENSFYMKILSHYASAQDRYIVGSRFDVKENSGSQISGRSIYQRLSAQL